MSRSETQGCDGRSRFLGVVRGRAAIARVLGVGLALACGSGGAAVAAGLGVAPADGQHQQHAERQEFLTPADFRHAPRDLVLWGDLARTQVKRGGGQFHVTYLPPVLALNGKRITLVGFMAPVHTGKLHRQFLLSDRPLLCPNCEAAPPPESIVEINAKVGEPARTRPIMVQGVFELVKDHPPGAIFRLNEAKVIRR